MVVAITISEIEANAKERGIDFAQVDLNSIILPPDEDFGIPSDDEEYEENLRKKLEDEDNLTAPGSVVIVDHLPRVLPEKFKKLEDVIRRVFSQYGMIKEEGFWMPVDPDTEITRGYCFIEYSTMQEAVMAKDERHGYKLDKNHVLAVNLMDDFDRLVNVPEEWSAPEAKPYSPGENLQEWLTDEKGRSQFLIRAGSDTEVLWNDPMQPKPEAVQHVFSTESHVQWSPLGTYLAAVHRQGAVVWGGALTFKRIMRYTHPLVKFFDFSPGEKFLVTYSILEPSNPCDTSKAVLNIFDVRSGKVLRQFKGMVDDFSFGGVSGVAWPVFRWGGGKEDKYFARIGKNVISVYETETFTLIEKKSLRVENVADYSWSPTDPILALFVPELSGGNQPAKVSLVQVPGKEELRQKNLFNVSDCKMYWQSNGEYLAVKVDRYTKTKKSTHTGFELFHIKERDIPIEVLELDNKNDKIIAFEWEPKGQRFAVIHGDSLKSDISFYSMQTSDHSGRVTKLKTLEGKQVNSLFWSPSGRFIVLAGLKGFNGQLEFFDVDELHTMKVGEHFMATNVEWDPSGRYVATFVTAVHEMENGFYIWSSIGELLYQQPRDRFYQFLWRPRPPSYLSADKEEDILRNLEMYAEIFKAKDDKVLNQVKGQKQEKRRKLCEEWEEWIQHWKQLHYEEKMDRQILRDGEESDEEVDFYDKEVEVEEVVDVKVEEA